MPITQSEWQQVRRLQGRYLKQQLFSVELLPTFISTSISIIPNADRYTRDIRHSYRYRLNEQHRRSPFHHFSLPCHRSRKTRVFIKLRTIPTLRPAKMGIPNSGPIPQSRGIVINHTDDPAANGTRPIDPALAACYILPYGAWGTGFHFILVWSAIYVSGASTSWAPGRRLSGPGFSGNFQGVCLLLLVVTSGSTFIDSDCENDLVFWTMLLHNCLVPATVFLFTILRLDIHHIDNSLEPFAVRNRASSCSAQAFESFTHFCQFFSSWHLASPLGLHSRVETIESDGSFRSTSSFGQLPLALCYGLRSCSGSGADRARTSTPSFSLAPY